MTKSVGTWVKSEADKALIDQAAAANADDSILESKATTMLFVDVVRV
jgi:hypothetical protein